MYRPDFCALIFTSEINKMRIGITLTDHSRCRNMKVGYIYTETSSSNLRNISYIKHQKRIGETSVRPMTFTDFLIH